MIFCFFVVRSRSSSFVWVLQGVRNGTVSLERLHFGGPRGRSRGIPHSSKAAGPVFLYLVLPSFEPIFLAAGQSNGTVSLERPPTGGRSRSRSVSPDLGKSFSFLLFVFFFGGRKNGASFLNFAFRRISWGREKEEDFLFFF